MKTNYEPKPLFEERIKSLLDNKEDIEKFCNRILNLKFL